MIKRIIISSLLSVIFASAALAQGVGPIVNTNINGGTGGIPYTPAGNYATPMSVTSASSQTTLPAGTTVIVYNTGTSPAYIKFGTSSSVVATTSNEVIQPGSWESFGVGSFTNIAAITSTSTTTLNISGGVGIGSGSGGGGSGGGGSTPTGPAGTPNTSVVSVQGIGGGTALPVSGTFWQATQPVSGTFWQTTQPVSGTFWQATQPVSLSSLPALASGANTIGSIANTSFGISGTLPAFAATPTVNAAESGTWNITNISGTISLPTGAATSANQPTNASIGSTTSGQSGHLALGAVTTSAPTYTTAQTDPLSLDTAGSLRVNCTTGCSSSGGSSLADEGTFTQGTTSFTVSGGLYTTSVANLTTGQAGALRLTNDRKLMTNQPNSEVAIGGATAAANALQAGGVYNTSSPTLTTGQGAALQLTAAGSLHTTVDNTISSITPGDAVSTGTYGSGSPTIGVSLLWNGTTYDRSKSGGATGVTAVGGGGASGSALVGNPVLVGGSNGTNTYNLKTDTSGDLFTNLATVGGTAIALGQTTMSASLPVAIASNQGAIPAQPQAAASGGALNSTLLLSAASNNAANVKNSAGTVYSITVTQSTATAMELKLYNTSTSPTCSSGTNLVDIIPIPSNATSPGYHLTYPVGRAFSTGISYCLTAFGNPAAATDNGNAATGVTMSMTYD